MSATRATIRFPLSLYTSLVSALAILASCSEDTTGSQRGRSPDGAVGDGDSAIDEGDGGDVNVQDASGSPNGDCGRVSPDNCEAAGCQSVRGRRYKPGNCESLQPIGCVSTKDACEGDSMLATDDLGGTWVVAGPCLPDRWESRGEIKDACLDGDSGMPPASECDSLALDQCASNDGCMLISGKPIDPVADCQEPKQPVDCLAKRACGAAFTFAKGQDDQVWLFSSSCVPKEWTVVTRNGDIPANCP